MSASVNGQRATSLRIFVPYTGPWFADIEMDGAQALTGRVSATYGQLTLSGTIDPLANGSRSDQQIARMVAGAGAWGRSVLPKDYANDAGVKALLIVQDAAREVGETLGAVAPEVPIVGRHYVRELGPASRALEDAVGGTPWWVDYQGRTQVGLRPPTPAAVGTYEVLDFRPRDSIVELSLDDLTAVGIGSVLTDGLDAPQTVRAMEIAISGDTVRIYAWCGQTGRDRIDALLEGIVLSILEKQLLGKHRYRLVAMDQDRVQLQVVNARAGLPNALPISIWPGVAGASANLTPGTEVLVEFLEGDRTQPVVVGFAGKDGVGFVPISLSLEATTEILIGGVGALPLALAHLCATEFGKIAATLATGANSGGDVIFATEYVPASVATTKAKGV
jgi:hypothetical protein